MTKEYTITNDVINMIDIIGMDQRVLMVLCGTPGSGKSTFADKFRLMCDHSNITIVSPDDIRKELSPDGIYESGINREVFNTAYTRVKEAFSEPGIVVYDATNCYQKWRSKILINVSDFYDTAICAISGLNLRSCLENNSTAHKDPVPDEVIEKMYISLRKNPPCINDGFDMVFKF